MEQSKSMIKVGEIVLIKVSPYTLEDGKTHAWLIACNGDISQS